MGTSALFIRNYSKMRFLVCVVAAGLNLVANVASAGSDGSRVQIASRPVQKSTLNRVSDAPVLLSCQEIKDKAIAECNRIRTEAEAVCQTQFMSCLKGTQNCKAICEATTSPDSKAGLPAKACGTCEELYEGVVSCTFDTAYHSRGKPPTTSPFCLGCQPCIAGAKRGRDQCIGNKEICSKGALIAKAKCSNDAEKAFAACGG